MSIKILGGVARGFSLLPPKSQKTRPTSVLLKRRLFDSIQDFTGSTFIDLCAGTGSMGLEALSRGATRVICVEENKACFQVLKQNAKAIQKYFENSQESKCEALCVKFQRWMERELESFKDLSPFIFFDPPYEDIASYDAFFSGVHKLPYEKTVIVEACEQKTMRLPLFEEKYGKPSKVFKQGTSFFAIYYFE